MATVKRTYELGGGRYTAVQNSDGTWNVLDVPICGEIPKGAKANKFDIDKAWLERAVANAHSRLKTNDFRPPLHLGHHEIAQQVERVGEFVPQRVGKLNYNGKEIYALFADLTRIPERYFSQIEKGELPYLSIEVEKWESEEIASLAIMPTDTPFFRFPNVTIGTKVHSFVTEAERCVQPSMAVALRATGTDGVGIGGLILCKLGGGIRLNDDGSEKKDEEKAEEQPKAGEEKPADKKGEDAPAAPAAPAAGEADGATMMAVLKQILAAVTTMAKAQSGVGAVEPAGDQDSKAPVEQEKPMPDQKDAASTPSTIKLQARVDALEAKDEERTKADAVKARADAAIASLKGWHLTDKMRSRILAFASEGQKQLDLYVESIREEVPKDPPATLQAFEQGAGIRVSAADPEADKVLAKYQTQSPEIQEKVRAAIALHARAKRMGATASCEKFVEAQLFAETQGYAGANGRA